MKINIKDYDSGYTMDKEYEKYIILNGGFLLQRLYSLPVYFVNEETMDKISPPKKKFNRDCVNEYLGWVYNEQETKEIRRYNENRYIFEREMEGKGYLYDKETIHSMFGNIDMSSLYMCKTSLFNSIGSYVQNDFIDSKKHIL